MMKLDELRIALDVGGIEKDDMINGRLDVGSPRGTTFWAPLHYACALQDEFLVQELLSSPKIDVNMLTQTKYGYSPLHIVARNGNVKLAKMLLEKNALTSSQVKENGSTPLHIAVTQGHTELVKLLLEHTKALIPTKNRTSPLDLAIKLSREDIKKLLVDHAQRYAEQEKLTNWLASIGMIEYEEVFQKAGFDDLDFLAQHGMSELDLDAMGIKKPGHRLKLQKLYMLKEFLEKLKPKVQEPEDEDEDDDEEEEEEEEAEEEEDEEVEENDEDSDQDEDD